MSKKSDARYQNEVRRRVEAEARAEVAAKIIEARDAAAATPSPAPAPAPAPKAPTLRERRAEIDRIEHPTARAAAELLWTLDHEAQILTGGLDAPAPASGQ
jgi:hypothetical protein